MARKPIQAAGGIVVRNGARPLIAIVQRAKDDRWVLPRGKLKINERPVAGARREVVEETGHRVEVREFLGAITYRAQGRAKLVQFWHMRARVNPSHDLMKDIAAVAWLPLAEAVRRLSYPLEKLFLRSVGRALVRHRRRKASKVSVRSPKTKARRRSRTRKRKAAARGKTRARVAKRKARRAGTAAARRRTAAAKPRAPKSIILKPVAVSAAPPQLAVVPTAAPQAVVAGPVVPMPVRKPLAPVKQRGMLGRMLGRLAN
jgi:8-oxo-dGTP diphosphatase